jgi:1-acyl-sn-glycerol-3-phosphate acyltransferase
MRAVPASIRFVFFLVSTFGLYSLYLLLKPVKTDDVAWRRIIFGAWAKSFVRIADFSIEIVGERPKAPFFLVSNHLGYIDIPIIRSELETLYVSKSEVREWPIAGRIVRDMGTIFIDRRNHRDIPRAGEEILAALSRNEGVTIFPEGTSGSGKELLAINSSFFEFPATNSIPVVVMTVHYFTDERDPAPSESVSWWNDTSFAKHLYNLFKLRSPKAVIRFGETVSDGNRKVLAKSVETEMKTMFNPMK